MKAKILVQTLRYASGLKIVTIAKNLGVSKVTIYKWLKGLEPLDKKHYDLLKKLIEKNTLNFNRATKETQEILNELDGLKNENWKNIILGLQEKLNMEQFQLLSKLGLNRDFHVSEWISGKRIPIYSKKFKIIEFVKKNNFKALDLIKFGMRCRQSIKADGKWISVKDTLKSNCLDEDFVIHKDGKKYLNPIFLFPKYKGKNIIKFSYYGEKIIVFYDEKSSTRPVPLILPRYLELNEIFLVGLGIYLGEGARNRKPKVTNSEPLVISKSIEFFKILGIDRPKLRAWIQLHERSDKTFEEARSFWLRNTLLQKENITKIRVKKSSGNAKVKPFGVLHLEANFILLQLLIRKIIGFIPVIIKNVSREHVVSFLQGAFAAEGSVGLAKSGTLREIRYTSTRNGERRFIKNLLEKLGLVVHDYKEDFDLRIFGFDNLRKLVEIDIFRYHPIRKKKLLVGFRKLEIFKKNL